MLHCSHTVAVYSSWGLTSQRYAWELIFLEDTRRFLRRKPRYLSALSAMLLMWLSHFTLFWMVYPRYFADVTASTVCWCRLYKVGIGVLRLVTCRTLHLSGWNFIYHRSSHLASLSRYSWSSFPLFLGVTVRYVLVSSANNHTLEFRFSWRSLM